MIKLSKMTDYAVVCLGTLARKPGNSMSATELSKETGLPVHIAEDPLACVAIGTGKALEQEEIFSTVLSEY